MAKVDQFLVESLEQHIQDLDRRREDAANLIRAIQRAGNERSPYSEVETPVILDDAPVPTGAPLEPWWREFAEELAEEPAEREGVTA
jgi:hypothetical protein